MGDEPRSAIIIRVPLPPALARIRRQWDWSAGLGVPGHVTILFPFLPAGNLSPGIREDLVSIATAHPPFDIQFPRVGRFPGVAYLEPEPALPLRRLTEAVVARFPGFPPYEGAFDEIVPHLTLADDPAAPLDRIARDAEAALPFDCRATGLELIVEDPGVGWRTRWRIRLGAHP